MSQGPTANILGSYHYLKNKDLTTMLSGYKVPIDFFADSGGFSAATQGASINLEEYAQWLVQHRKVITAAATLDIIGNPKATEINTRRIQDIVGDAVYIVPTFHVGSPWSELERLTAVYPYIALGGAVALGARENALTQWLAKAHKIARENDCRLHGFGLTRPPYPQIVPWYSIDSSFWHTCARWGIFQLWDKDHWVKLKVGRSGALKHSAVIRSYGGVPKEVATLGFGLVSKRGIVQGRIDSDWISSACILSVRDHETWLRNRQLIDPPIGVEGLGIKMYFAIARKPHIDFIVQTLIDNRRITCPTL